MTSMDNRCSEHSFSKYPAQDLFHEKVTPRTEDSSTLSTALPLTLIETESMFLPSATNYKDLLFSLDTQSWLVS